MANDRLRVLQLQLPGHVPEEQACSSLTAHRRDGRKAQWPLENSGGANGQRGSTIGRRGPAVVSHVCERG